MKCVAIVSGFEWRSRVSFFGRALKISHINKRKYNSKRRASHREVGAGDEIDTHGVYINRNICAESKNPHHEFYTRCKTSYRFLSSQQSRLTREELRVRI